MPFQSTDEIRFQCRHILTDGRRCKNPTLRGPKSAENPDGHENFCYFHHTTRRPIQNPRCRRGRRSTFTLPLLEDRSSIQLAIGHVLQQIASNDIDPRRAGLLLYGLQVALQSLPKPNPKQESESTETVSEITHDPILGVLAPPAELGHDEPKSSIHLLLEHMDDIDHFDRLDSIQAVAEPAHLLELPTTAPPVRAKILPMRYHVSDSQSSISYGAQTGVRTRGTSMRKLLAFCIGVILTVSFGTLRAHAATDVTGTWTTSMQSPDGNGSFDLTFNFKQDGSALTGTILGPQGDPLPIANGKIDGDKISFTVAFNGTTISHEGTVSGDQISLTSKSSDGSFPGMTLTLKRAKGEATPASPAAPAAPAAPATPAEPAAPPKA